jgi:hypothetical protein
MIARTTKSSRIVTPRRLTIFMPSKAEKRIAIYPAVPGRIDWALNWARKRTGGGMRIPTGGTTWPRGRLPDLGDPCQAWMQARRVRLAGKWTTATPLAGVSRPMRPACTYRRRSRLMRCCGKLQEPSSRLLAPGPVRSFQQVGCAMPGLAADLPTWSLDIAIHIPRPGVRGGGVDGCDASASRSRDRRRCLARRPSSNSVETAG